MIDEPPVVGPSFQEKPIIKSEVTAAIFAKVTGALGIITTIAPLPGTDGAEVPQLLNAVTIAYTLSPSTRL